MHLWKRIAIAGLLCQLPALPTYARVRWGVEQANAWYAHQPWPVGSNFIPVDAVNQLEMWQADTFDPREIDKELALAQGLGMTTMRVFLHDLLWQQDQRGFKQRLDQFLTIADRHHIHPILVLFDSCWYPFPKTGPQRPPMPGIHNSGWMQSPGAHALEDAGEYPRLETYVKGVVGAFAKDQRILAWDVWNEPDNTNQGSWNTLEPKNKIALVTRLLPQVFAWARSAEPTQPLTSGVWHDDPGEDNLAPVAKIQLEESDITSFHNYDWPESFEAHVVALERFHRPILCTEYMARPVGSTFDQILPLAKKYHVGAVNWGFVAGKTQTYLPWDSWQHPYIASPPPVWFHEIFRQDYTPYREREIEIIRSATGVSTSPAQSSSAPVAR
ncbi:MAG: cellulase family glycosylhydrolase [Acidobacteriaceae bacterium]